jgi:hypothetical protein
MEELNQIAKSVPKEAWLQMAKTTCETFEKLILPLTATTECVGRLIQNKFNKLSIEQQLIAAKCIQEAEEKTKFKVTLYNTQLKVVKYPIKTGFTSERKWHQLKASSLPDIQESP